MAIIDRVKYDPSSDEWFVWKFPSEDLRLGSQLIVNQSQEALFVKGGQALDLFGPGTHTLTTGNLPLLARLVNMPFGGQTPFTAEIWFVNKTVKRDLKWGTKMPIQIMDCEANYPVHVRSFGRWGIRVSDSASLIRQVVGAQANLRGEKILEYFIGEILQKFTEVITRIFVNEKTSVFTISAQVNRIARETSDDITAEFQRFGIEVVNFNVEGASIPPDEMKQLQDIYRTLKLQREGAVASQSSLDIARGILESGKNPKGGAGPLVMPVVMPQIMPAAMPQSQPAPVPAPAPQAVPSRSLKDVLQEIEEARSLLDDATYQAMKKEAIDKWKNQSR